MMTFYIHSRVSLYTKLLGYHGSAVPDPVGRPRRGGLLVDVKTIYFKVHSDQDAPDIYEVFAIFFSMYYVRATERRVLINEFLRASSDLTCLRRHCVSLGNITNSPIHLLSIIDLLDSMPEESPSNSVG